MEAGRIWFNRLWRSPIGTVLLYGALLVHFLMALHALYRRRTLRMPPREVMQLLLGLGLPFLITAHVVGTRLEWSVSGWEAGYPEVVRNLWINRPELGLRQTIALVIAWLHGCLGIYFWLRPKPWFPRLALVLYTAAVFLPVFALLGFAEAGREIASLPDRFPPVQRPESGSMLLAYADVGLYAAFTGLIGATFFARAIRSSFVMRRRIRISYPNNRTVSVPLGLLSRPQVIS